MTRARPVGTLAVSPCVHGTGDSREDGLVSSTYEHIVLGAGGIGAAAAYWLARRGGSVLALEQYRLGHDRGASEDHSRIIRHSYHTTEYTSLTRAAYDHVRDLEDETGLELLRITGGLNLAPSDDAGQAEIGSYARALAEQGHTYEVMDGDEVHSRWPQWQVGADVVGLYQAESGILDIRRVNSAHISRARALGVRFLDQTPARKIVPFADHVEVHTDDEVFEAGTLTICAGSWTDTLTAGLGLDFRLTLTQEQVTYFAAADLRAFAPDRFPVWIFHDHDKTFYGFPVYGEAAVKAARDMSGRFVTQQTRRFEPDPGQTAEVAEFLARYLPGAAGPELVSKTCVYDLTADRNFILDTVPGHPRIGVFVGAGHAAKFVGLIGHILADLAVDGRTGYPIEAFSISRPAVRDPDFPSDFRFSRAAQTPAADPAPGT
jgi:monomeric sarcosine oxidase